MPSLLPEIPEADDSPLVRQLVEIIRDRQRRIERLEDELARLKGLNARPVIAPSPPGTPAKPPPAPGRKRPGSEERSKTACLTITETSVVPLDDEPPGATFKGHEDFVVQDLILRPRVIRHRRERWLTPTGRTRIARPHAEVIPGSHFGPGLICFILHRYHHRHVTQPLSWEQLDQPGIDISAGQLSRILTEGKDAFHREKDRLLPAALEVSPFVQVDDTGARHRGRNGYCTQIGNDLFASFESTGSKSRLNFLEILRRPHSDYVIDEIAEGYWRGQKLAVAVIDAPRRGPRRFADATAWNAHLQGLGITAERHVRIASEGALLGSLIAHGVSAESGILSDGAGRFDVPVHIACWIHAERPLARMVPYSDEHRAAIEGVRQRIWELYQDLKAYRLAPEEARRPVLEARFDEMSKDRTGFPGVDAVLRGMGERRADLLGVLGRPEFPLHNDLSEGHMRDYVKERKISGGTRSESGRRARDSFASLKKTCRRLGVNFWAYLQDRVRCLHRIPPLSELIRRRGQELWPAGGPTSRLPAETIGAAT
ncbi:MAG TPA: transposase [Thermoanaerobaculia bacterium]